MGNMENWGETTGRGGTETTHGQQKTEELQNKAIKATVADIKEPQPEHLADSNVPVPTAALSIVRETPMLLPQLMDPLRTYLIKPKRPDLEKAREFFYKELQQLNLTTKQRDALWKFILRRVGTHLGNLAAEDAKKFARAGKKEELKGALRAGKFGAKYRAEGGEGTFNENQRKFLLEVTKELTDTQKMDVYRAALEVGFSAPSVFSAASPKKEENYDSKAIENNLVLQQLLNQSILIATEMNRQVEEARKKWESDQDNEQLAEEYKRAYAGLAAFLGKENNSEVDPSKLAAQGDEAISISLAMSMDLYGYGRLDIIVPKRTA